MTPRILIPVSLALATGCGTSLRYSPGDTAVRMSAAQRAQAKLAVVDIMDGRARGQPAALPFVPGDPREKSLTEVRESFREHALEAGLVAEAQALLPAPKSRAALDQLLNEAASRGAQSILLVRLDAATALGYRSPVAGSLLMLMPLVGILPGIIAASLTINEERVGALVRGFLVDVQGRVVVARFEHLYEYYDDDVTLWGFGPADELADGLFVATDAVLGQAHTALTRSGRADETAGLEAVLAPAPLVFVSVDQEASR